MKENNPYIFEEPRWGTIELEIGKSNRDFYSVPEDTKFPFGIRGFGNKELPRPHFHLFEWQKLQFTYVVDVDTDLIPPFSLRVNNRELKSSKKTEKIHILSEQLSFEDQVGETKIELRDQKNRLIFELWTEVFPQKMDYKSDYKAMMSDISEILESLAFDSLKDTFRSSRARTSGQSTDNEWWSILDALFAQLLVHIGVIKRQPVHEIRTVERVESVDKIRNPSKRNRNWFQKNGGFSNKSGSGIKVGSSLHFSHALSAKKFVTYDTYENRFIAWAIRSMIDRLRQYGKVITASDKRGNYQPLTDRIRHYQGKLQGILHESPFNEVGEFEKRSLYSNSLTRGAGYRDFMHIFMLLTRGLELADNEIFKIELKNISTLYEYWCFLNLIKIAKETLNLPVGYQDIIKIQHSRTRVALVKGNQSKVQLGNKEIGEQVNIYYNREFRKDSKKIFTYNQVPDITIEFHKKGYQQPFWYVLDAKYRFEEKSIDKGEGRDQKFNVPQDAIGQLHRYRDAILHTVPDNSSYRRAIKNLGGIILYPYPKSEEDFLENDFYKSIEQINIGALPFLPSKSGLVTDLLRRMILETSPEQHFDRFIEMDGDEYQTSNNKWKELVTIVGIPIDHQSERIEFISNMKICHVPFVKNLHSKIYASKKILLCKSGTTDASLYDVVRWEVLTKEELSILGSSWPHRTDKYLAFHLENGTKIETPKKLSPINFRYASLEGLTRYLKNPKASKDYFYLTNPDAARLYKELSLRKLSVTIDWKDNLENPFLVVFRCENLVIESSDNFGNLLFKVRGQENPQTLDWILSNVRPASS